MGGGEEWNGHVDHAKLDPTAFKRPKPDLKDKFYTLTAPPLRVLGPCGSYASASQPTVSANTQSFSAHTLIF